MALRPVTNTVTFRESVDVRKVAGLRAFSRLDGVGVKAGIIEGESEDYPDGTSVVMVATVQHDGSGNIPSRPWLATAFDQNERMMKEQMEAAAEAILLGRSTTGVQMALVGQQLLAVQRQQLVNMRPPLKESTIARKRANPPPGGRKFPADTTLYDTGHLMKEHVVVIEGKF